VKRTALLTSLAATAVLGLAGCGGDEDPLASDGADSADSGGGGSEVVIGSANFPENALLAEIYAGALEAAGVETETKLNIGSREVYLKALEPGDESVDIFPEYTGVLRDYFEPGQPGTDSDEVYDELVASLPDYLTVLEPSSAEDKDAVVVTQETADEHSLVEIGDLAPVAGDMTLGGPPEWKTRDTGVPGLEEVYGVTFSDFRALDAGGPLTLQALLNGQIDAGNLFTTDPNIAAEELVVLEDPDSLFAAQNVVPLVRSEVLNDDIESALNDVSAALDTEKLGELVTRVVIDKEDPEDVAEDFLAEAGLD
jgi:osmoprotectant transport system substrate-binding protein